MSARGAVGAAESGGEIEQVAAGAAVALIGRFLGRGLILLTNIILARGLGPAVFGIYALGLTFLRIGRLGVTLGLEQGIVHFGAPLWRRDSAALGVLIRRALGASMVASLVAAAVLYTSAPWIESFMDQPDLAWTLRRIAPAFPLLAMLSIVAATTRISRRLTFSVIAEDIVQGASQALITLLLLAAGWGIAGALFGLTASYLIAALVAVFFLVRLVPATLRPAEAETALPGMATVLSFSLQSSMGLLFTLLTLWLDRLMIGVFRPAADVGVYQAVAQIASLFPLILNAFMAILWPMFAFHGHQRDHARIGELFRIGVRWGLILATPPFLIVCLESRLLLGTVFDQRYLVGAVPLVILAIGQMVNAATGPVAPMLLNTGFARAWFYLSGAALAANFALNLVLVPRWGMVGAAVATMISIACLFVAGLVLARRRIGLRPYDRYVVRWLVSMAIATVVVLLIRAHVPTSLVGLVLSALACGGVFLAVVACFPAAPEEKALAKQLWRRFRPGADSHPSS